MMIERLGEIVVGARFKPFNDVLAAAHRCQKNDVDRGRARRLAHLATDFDSAQARHHPIQDSQARRVLCLHCSAGFDSVCGYDNFMTPLTQIGLEHTPGNGIIFGDQYSQAATPSLCSISRRMVCTFCAVQGFKRKADAPAAKLSPGTFRARSAVIMTTGMRIRRFSVLMYRMMSIPCR